MPTQCSTEQFEFARVEGHKVVANLMAARSRRMRVRCCWGRLIECWGSSIALRLALPIDGGLN
jgi:hypothetical protein